MDAQRSSVTHDRNMALLVARTQSAWISYVGIQWTTALFVVQSHVPEQSPCKNDC